jgi:putative glycosyltransferase (TIGR04372 family)
LLLLRIEGRLRRFRCQGFKKTALEVARRTGTAFLGILLMPVAAVLHVLGFRRLTVFTERIGHLALEVDYFLKQRALGQIPERRYFLTAPKWRVANRHLMKLWSQHIPVIENPVAAFLLESMGRWYFMRHDVSEYTRSFNKAASMFAIAAAWGNRPPILRLPVEDERWGRQVLKALGVPDDRWFVAVHVREGGFSPDGDWAHSNRNGSISAVVPAIRYIYERGGWCVRLGDPSMTVLPDMPGVTDYAHSPLRSERMDIFLCAKARFFIGNTSGITYLASAFGVPCVWANMIPTSTLGLSAADISIPKLLYSKVEQRFLHFPEIFASPLANYRYAVLYDAAGIEVRENSDDEILDLVREMMERLDGCMLESEQDVELQQRYLALLRPEHYSWGTVSKIGTAFLRKHRDLLEPPQNVLANSPAWQQRNA